MAATFARETAVIQKVYIRRHLVTGEDAYDPLPFSLVKYDDGTTYIEPDASPGLSDMTARDAEGPGVLHYQIILDRPPYNGLFELH